MGHSKALKVASKEVTEKVERYLSSPERHEDIVLSEEFLDGRSVVVRCCDPREGTPSFVVGTLYDKDGTILGGSVEHQFFKDWTFTDGRGEFYTLSIERHGTPVKHGDGFDVFKRPSHYCKGRTFEPKDVIRDWGLNFNLGNVVKYVSRAGRKGDALQDLQKAAAYLQFEIDALRKEAQEEEYR